MRDTALRAWAAAMATNGVREVVENIVLLFIS